MCSTLIVCFCFVTIGLNAEIISPSDSTPTSISTTISAPTPINSSASVFDIEEELAKIDSDCFNARDYELLVGGGIRYNLARKIGYRFITESVATIGLQELRTALGLSPPGPWKEYNSTKPSEKQLESASTIEEYYNLKEPKTHRRSLDSEYLFENNVATAVEFLDKRLPSIRIIFRRTFEESSSPEVLDKKTVDNMIEKFKKTFAEVNEHVSSSAARSRTGRCWDDYTNKLDKNDPMNSSKKMKIIFSK